MNLIFWIQELKYPESKRFKIGLSEMIGRRPTMEDAILIRGSFWDNESDLIGIFDGHGGVTTANLIAAKFPDIISSQLKSVKGNIFTYSIS